VAFEAQLDSCPAGNLDAKERPKGASEPEREWSERAPGVIQVHVSTNCHLLRILRSARIFGEKQVIRNTNTHGEFGSRVGFGHSRIT